MLIASVDYSFGRFMGLTGTVTNRFSERGPDSKARGPFNPRDMYVGITISAAWADPTDDD